VINEESEGIILNIVRVLGIGTLLTLLVAPGQVLEVRADPLPPPAFLDTDGDGALDDHPEGAVIDECTDEVGPLENNGCPLPPPDTDNDGTEDAADTCPTVPNPTQQAGVTIAPDGNLYQAVASDPIDRNTDFCLLEGTYAPGDTIPLKRDPGDNLYGQEGTLEDVEHAQRPHPVVEIVNQHGLTTIVSSCQNTIQWIAARDADGKKDASGKAISGHGRNFGTCDEWGTVYRYVEGSGGDAMGANGGALYDTVWMHDNGNDPDYLGFTAAGIKADEEFIIVNSVLEDNGGNGAWCDAKCEEVAELGERGLYWADNVAQNNNRKGLRLEHSPMCRDPEEVIPGIQEYPGQYVGCKSGIHKNWPTALVENNTTRGNRDDGINVHDFQNGTVRDNDIYDGMRLTDSGRPERTDAWNNRAEGNRMHGSELQGCEKPFVTCVDNT
jgi:hypothetical protein